MLTSKWSQQADFFCRKKSLLEILSVTFPKVTTKTAEVGAANARYKLAVGDDWVLPRHVTRSGKVPQT